MFLKYFDFDMSIAPNILCWLGHRPRNANRLLDLLNKLGTDEYDRSMLVESNANTVVGGVLDENISLLIIAEL
jgi:hypothetical protein